MALERFDDPDTDPQLARLLVSNYNSHLRLESGDIRFLITALRHYLARSLPWLTKLRPDTELGPARSALLQLLSALAEHTDEDDIVTGVKDLRAALSAGS